MRFRHFKRLKFRCIKCLKKIKTLQNVGKLNTLFQILKCRDFRHFNLECRDAVVSCFLNPALLCRILHNRLSASFCVFTIFNCSFLEVSINSRLTNYKIKNLQSSTHAQLKIISHKCPYLIKYTTYLCLMALYCFFWSLSGFRKNVLRLVENFVIINKKTFQNSI